MPPPKGGDKVADVLAKFRTQQIKASKLQQEATKQRQERLKRIQNGGVPKKPAGRQSRGRARSSSSLNVLQSPLEGTDGRTGAKDWRTARASSAAPELPLGMRQKQVIDFLRQYEEPASAGKIMASTGRNLESELELAEALSSNPKVSFNSSDKTWCYQPDSNVRNKQQLMDYVRKSALPVLVSDLADAYRGVSCDIASLKRDGVVYGLHSFDPDINSEVLFPIDVSMKSIKADNDVRALWLGTVVPDEDTAVAEALQKAGIEPSHRKPTAVHARETRKKRKKRKPTKLRAVTNVHLMHLLEGEAPTAIDALPNAE